MPGGAQRPLSRSEPNGFPMLDLSRPVQSVRHSNSTATGPVGMSLRDRPLCEGFRTSSSVFITTLMGVTVVFYNTVNAIVFWCVYLVCVHGKAERVCMHTWRGLHVFHRCACTADPRRIDGRIDPQGAARGPVCTADLIRRLLGFSTLISTSASTGTGDV